MQKLRNLLRKLKLNRQIKNTIDESTIEPPVVLSSHETEKILNHFRRLFRLRGLDRSAKRSSEINKVKSSLRYYVKKHGAKEIMNSIMFTEGATPFTVQVADELLVYIQNA